jgi:hypothetical protein
MTVILSERSESKDLRLHFGISTRRYSQRLAEQLGFVSGHHFSRAEIWPLEESGL